MNESTREKIAALVDHKVATPVAKDDTTWDAISREAYVIGGGLLDGFTSNANTKSLLQRTPEIIASVGIGAGLAIAKGKTGMIKLGAEIVGLSFAVGMAKDLTSKERIDGLSTAIGNTWRSPSQLDYNRALVKHHAGDFAFDTTLMAAGGIVGASSVRVGKTQAAQQLRSLIGNGMESVKRTARTAFTSSEVKAATSGLTEVRSGSFGATELRSAGLGVTETRLGATSARSGSVVEKALGATEVRTSSQGLMRPSVMEPLGRDAPAYEVLPEGPIKSNSQSRRLVENADKLPLADVQKTETVTWTLDNGKSVDWKPTSDGIGVRLEAQRFVDAFMKGDYAAALNVAIEAPVMGHVNLNPPSRLHEVRIAASELAQPEILQLRMNSLSAFAEFKWRQTVMDGLVRETKLDVVIPKPIIELNSGASVRLVDFVPVESNGYRTGYKMEFPEKAVGGNPLTPEQIAEIRAIRQSEPGQRLLAETAIFGYEETIVHANQHITRGGSITSPAFAEFSRDMAARNEQFRGHRLGFLGMIDTKHPMRETLFEQEVPALAYDAGMPLEVVRHHFFYGPRHVDMRRPVMNFLQNRELMGSGK